MVKYQTGLGGNRWTSMIAGLYLELAGGVAYGWGAYSVQVRAALNLSQGQANAISTCLNLGSFTGIIGGILNDRIGCFWTSLFGIAIASLGYFMAYALTSFVEAPDPATTTLLMCIFYFVAGQGSGWMDTTAVATTAYNFDQDAGRVLGIVKSFFGLSGSLFALFYKTFFARSQYSFGEAVPCILFISLMIPAITLPVMPVFSRNRGPKLVDTSMITYGYIVVGVLAAMLVALVPMTKSWAPQTHTTENYICLGSALFFVFVLLPQMGIRGKDPPLLDSVAINNAQASEDPREALLSTTRSVPLSLEECSASQTLMRVNFWLTIFALASGLGAGLMLINNIGQIAQAYGGDGTAFVTIIAACNAGGRMFFGWASDALRSKLSAPDLIALCGAMIALSHLLMGLGSDLSVVYVGCVLTGTGFGGLFSLNPKLCPELFGYKNFGANYNLFKIAPAVGGIFFSAYLAAAIYNQHTPEGSKTCLGQDCFRMTHFACAGANIVGLFCAMALSTRTRSFYVLKNMALDQQSASLN